MDNDTNNAWSLILTKAYRVVKGRFKPRVLLSLLLFCSAGVNGAIGITLVQNPNFGLLLAGSSSRNFILNTDGVVTGSHALDAVSGAWQGIYMVTDDNNPANISILVDSITTFGSINVNQVLCSYNGASQARCDGVAISASSVASASLTIGLAITTTAVHNGGDVASADMNITLVYE